MTTHPEHQDSPQHRAERSPKHNEYLPYIKLGVTAFLVIAASILLFFTIFHLDEVMEVLGLIGLILRPIFLGLVFAFLLLPVHRHIKSFLEAQGPQQEELNEKKKALLNAASILLSLIFAFAILYILLDMVVPQVYMSIVGLIQAVPDYIQNAHDWIMAFLADNPEIQQAVVTYYNTLTGNLEAWLSSDILPNLESFNDTLTWLRETVMPNITGVVTNVSTVFLQSILWLKDILIGIIVSVYLLARKDTFAAQTKKMVYSIFTPAHGDFIVEETRSAYKILSGFINGKLLDSFIIGCITLVCCNLFHFPYPALVAAIVGVTNIIPFFGPFIGAVPCALLILLVSPLQCLYFIIFILVLQQFDGNILGPKILGESTGLASFWVLFSIIFFGGLFGFAGMVLGVPFFAMVYSLIRRLVNYGLRRHHLPVSTELYMGPTGALAQNPPEPPAPDYPEAK